MWYYYTILSFHFSNLEFNKGPNKEHEPRLHPHLSFCFSLLFMEKTKQTCFSEWTREKKRAHYFPSLSLLSRQINPSVVLNFEIVAQALFNSHSLSLSLSICDMCGDTTDIQLFFLFLLYTSLQQGYLELW